MQQALGWQPTAGRPPAGRRAAGAQPQPCPRLPIAAHQPHGAAQCRKPVRTLVSSATAQSLAVLLPLASVQPLLRRGSICCTVRGLQVSAGGCRRACRAPLATTARRRRRFKSGTWARSRSSASSRMVCSRRPTVERRGHLKQRRQRSRARRSCRQSCGATARRPARSRGDSSRVCRLLCMTQQVMVRGQCRAASTKLTLMRERGGVGLALECPPASAWPPPTCKAALSSPCSSCCSVVSSLQRPPLYCS